MARLPLPRIKLLRALFPAILTAAAFSLFAQQSVDPTPIGGTMEQRTNIAGNATTAPVTKHPSGVTISLAPSPFQQISANGQIVREFVVQNDNSVPANVYIRLNFTDNWRGNTVRRSVSTQRMIPGNSRQVVTLFVPSGIPYTDHYEHLESADPQIYVNGSKYRPLPTGIMNDVQVDQKMLKLPSSFGNEGILLESLAYAMRKDPSRSGAPRRSWENEVQVLHSDSDTIQWPSVPQFYQADDVLYRKNTDPFTPDAETAINDAVMLGATELYFVAPGTQWPEWAPRPQPPAIFSVIPRGFGRTVVIDENYLRGIAPGAPGNPGFNPDEDEKPMYNRNNNRDLDDIERLNPRLFGSIRDASVLRAFNPSALFLLLPSVEIPAISFAVVIFALLAYILIVGPGNYWWLNKKKKSVLLLLFTVPAISLTFVAIVIVFVALFEGWYTRASAVGVTFLDQNESRAYTRAAVNLYAPVPVRKLTFDTSDTVSFTRTGTIDVALGRDQVITGANRARVPLTYGISRAEKRLEQLRVSRTPDGGVAVMNGLGSPVKIRALHDPSGSFWTSGDSVVAPGATLALHPLLEDLPTATPQDFAPGMFTTSGGTTVIPATAPADRRTVTIPPGASGPYTEHGPVKTDDDMPTPGTPWAVTPTRNDLLMTAAAMLLGDDDLDTSRRYRDSVNILGHRDRDFGHWLRNDLTNFRATLQANPEAAALTLEPGMYLAETDAPLFYNVGCKPVSFHARHLVVGTFTLQESAHEN